MAAALPSLNIYIFSFIPNNFKVSQILDSAKLNILVITQDNPVWLTPVD